MNDSKIEDQPKDTGKSMLMRWLKRRWPLVLITFIGAGLLIIMALLQKAEAFLGGGLDEWEVPHKTLKKTENGYDLAIYSTSNPEDEYELGILFIHGTPGSADNFKHQFKESWPDTVLVSYNRPGFWNSKASAPVSSLSKQTEAAFEVMKHFKVNKWILAGHSYGGPIAIQMAIQRPEIILGTIQIGGALDPELEKVHLLQHLGESIVFNWLVPSSIDASNKELIQLKADLEQLKPQLKDLKSHVVMLHGSSDSLVPVSNCDYMEKELKKHGLEQLLHLDIQKEVDHFIPWSHPETIKKNIDFLINKSGLEL